MNCHWKGKYTKL